MENNNGMSVQNVVYILGGSSSFLNALFWCMLAFPMIIYEDVAVA